MATENKKRRWRLSRRGFLIGAGVLGGGIALGYGVGLPAARLKIAEVMDSGIGQPVNIDKGPLVWIDIAPDNGTTFYIPKIEMGQGIHTALAQILAEELGADWQQVHVIQADTVHGPVDSAGTTGSQSVSSMWPVLRDIAANLREMLRAEAARQLGKPVAQLKVMKGFVLVDGASGTGAGSAEGQISFGELIQNKQGAWEVPKDKPVLKPMSEFNIVGQSMQRVDLFDKLTGQAIYAYDVRLPNMAYGAVARPPTFAGKLRSAAKGTAEEQPGVIKVVAEPDFAGVVAETRQQAAAAVTSLALDWDAGKLWQQAEIEQMLEIKDGAGTVIQNDGTGTAMPANDAVEAGQMIEAHYSSPFAAHAHLEPQAALADWQPDKLRLWVGTQMPALTRGDVAKAMGLKEEQIEVMPTYLGGGFGRKYGSDVAISAARLSRAAGRPVHVAWTRKEEFQNGYLRPPTRHILRATLGADGRISSMAHLQSSGEVANSFLPAAMTAVMGADFGAWRGARLHYDGIPNRYTRAQVASLPIRTGWWRGLGLLANVFAIETFVDELAHAAKVDPLEFRLQHLPAGAGPDSTSERLRNVLMGAAKQAGWDTPLPQGRARGIACCTDAGTTVAQVAEVSVEGGKIRVHKVVSAIDPGLIINPDGVKAQTEGAITMGLSSTLFEETRIENGRVSADNFDAYPLITMRDTPEIEVVLLQTGLEPHGVGEPPIGPIAAAVGNAVFALTGQRLRTLPLKLV